MSKLQPTIIPFLVLAVAALSFLLGRQTSLLEAQGRGPTRPAPAPAPDPDPGPGTGVPPLVFDSDEGPAAQGFGMVAVTGSYGVGTSVLYVIDTINRQLAVYEARGGTDSMARIKLVGARRIDLDLQLESFNDESKYDYTDLKDLFARRPGAKDESEKR